MGKQASKSAALKKMQRELHQQYHPFSSSQLTLFPPSATMYIDAAVQHLIDGAAEHIDRTATLIRYGALSPARVYGRLHESTNHTSKYERWMFGEIATMATPKRLRAFQHNSKCVCCGREGNVYIVERHKNDVVSQYLNLYSAASNGLTMITVDHILPDSMGGRYSFENFQTMCKPCNQAKTNIMSAKEIALVKADPGKYAKAWMNLNLVVAMCDLQLALKRSPSQDYTIALTDIFTAVRKSLRQDMKQHVIDKHLANIKRIIAAESAYRKAAAPQVPSIWKRFKTGFQKILSSLQFSLRTVD